MQTIFYKKAPSIIKRIYELEEVVVDPASPKEIVSDEKFAYLGRHYRLKVLKKCGEIVRLFIQKTKKNIMFTKIKTLNTRSVKGYTY
ncbi:M48 family metallopeptidase [Metabacillus sediminilitoris]|uniref:M48 family metallopeptidase n=1 Tax=Metabacillus sediminilitoris TaxID=2567941 RepID=A0A4S4C1M0_9BACI|nr:DUF45 domain-containing protein [Metabacillus sediminilitoris]THF79438.1 M48 family metallopeptidase [Metabacillus sediminilitoris]